MNPGTARRTRNHAPPLTPLRCVRGSELSRQVGLTHQIAVALAGRAAALIDRPDDETLAAPHVAGGEHARHVRAELAVLRLRVAAAVLLDAELVEHRALRPAEAQGEQHQ